MSEFRKSVYSTKTYTTQVADYREKRIINLSILWRNKLILALLILSAAALAADIIFFGNPIEKPAGSHIIVRPP
jgi:hypothetical protein